MVIGIDPGFTGAIVFLWPDNGLRVYDLPIVKDKKIVDIRFLKQIIEDNLDGAPKADVHVFFEDSFSLPTHSTKSMLTYGIESGRILGLIEAMDLKKTTVPPSVWKAALGLSSNKNDSLALAKKLFPKISKWISLKKHHGRAEALLLAYFGRRMIESPSRGKTSLQPIPVSN